MRLNYGERKEAHKRIKKTVVHIQKETEYAQESYINYTHNRNVAMHVVDMRH